MSLNQVVSTGPKNWLNIKANTLKVDGNISMRDGVRGYALCYHGPKDMRFSPLSSFQLIGVDQFNMVPILNAAPSTVDFVASTVPLTNFSLNSDSDIVCNTTGTYLVSFKFVLNSQLNSSRPNPYFSVNFTVDTRASMRIPLCNRPIPQYAGLQESVIMTLQEDDVLTLNLAIQPSGTTTMVNEATASNVILIKLS